MKRLIFGNGKVSKIIRHDNDIIIDRSKCDINNELLIRHYIKQHDPDVVINCAAKTNLEYCQANKTSAFKSNVNGVLNLIEVCNSFNKKPKLIHISSGCLFDGNDFISDENTPASPAVWYTWTKKWADEIIENYGYKNYLILRPRQLISKTPHPSNMITKFSNMKSIKAIEEKNSLTCIEDFSEMIDHLINIDATGIFNCANTGVISPYDIALLIKLKLNNHLDVSKISYEELLSMLPNRRVNTVLSCQKLIDTGYTPRSAIDALNWCLENYGK